MRKLNLGCGKTRIKGYVNLDLRGGDVIGDAMQLPFKDKTFDYILAPHVLEHVTNLGNTIMELHRILCPGGLLRIYVPYGLKALYHPFHVNAFHLVTLNGFCFEQDTSLEYGRFFNMLEARISCHSLPISYHIERYGGIIFRGLVRLGVFDPPKRPGRLYGWKLPLTPRIELTFLLERDI